jgi:uncharacterized membrane protein
MSYKLCVLVTGLMGYSACLAFLQASVVRTILCYICAFVVGIGIVLVRDEFEHLENEVAKLREQITQPEKSDEPAAENNR